MRLEKSILFCILLCAPAITAQDYIKGQIFLPNGAPIQRITRFTLTTENGTRTDYFFTDSNGRISLARINTPFTITVESDGENYDTTTVSFDPRFAGNYVTVRLRPLQPTASKSPRAVDASEVDQQVSPRAREAYESATKLLQSQQYDLAIEPLKRAISLQSNYFRAYDDLGVAYMNLKQFDQAADAFRHAIKINEKIVHPQLNLGIVLNHQGKYIEAAEVLSKLEAGHPEVAAARPALIEALIGAQKWAPAEAQIKAALNNKEMDKVDLNVKLGMVLIRQRKFDVAVAPLRDAVQTEPDNALAHFNLGAALLQAGKLDEAEAALRRAYEIKGSNMPGAQLMLGELYFQKKDYPKALEAFEAYLRDLPDAPNAAQVKEAVQKLRQALGKQ